MNSLIGLVNDHQQSVNRDPVNGGTCATPVGKGCGMVVEGPAARASAEVGVPNAVDPARERAYWSENFRGRRYVREGSSFDDYGPAYGFGITAWARYPGRNFDEVAPELSSDWAASRGESSLSWGRARHAARDAWDRISE